ncbi:adenosylcobinamide-GDP ribazoletransferase [Thiovibrio sp. JS02]
MLLAARIAIAFLTIVPLPLPAQLSGEQLARSAAFFPLAGWLLGCLLAGACWVFVYLQLPALVAAVLLVGLAAWLTRGLHLDGVADLADGLGGGHEPARRLAIMKDSATGAFGVISLVLLLALKISCLATLYEKGQAIFFVFFAMPVTARWAMATLAFRTSYPREGGTGHSFVGKVRGGDLALGALFMLPLLVWQWPLALAILAAGLLPAVTLRFLAQKALGGITGDVLGAACELAEACCLVAAVILP